MKSIRFTPETIKFLESQGKTATVINTIVENAVQNWDAFEEFQRNCK